MIRKPYFLLFLLITFRLSSQQVSFTRLLGDSTMTNASVSFMIRETENGNAVFEYHSKESLSQASVMKLFTTAAALELLGPDHVFRTKVGYTGKISNGTLSGNIIIKGGGDPALGSRNFADHYGNFLDKWVNEISRLGVKKIKGRIIADDTYFDYQPVPAKWNWEDMGNYYGAGAYGLSVFDNTLKLHFTTGQEGTKPKISLVEPSASGISYTCNLTASGSTDEGYVYSAPYSDYGWIEGTIPVNNQDFVLKASIPDPPMMVATLLNDKLRKAGINIKQDPGTARRIHPPEGENFVLITETVSPTLSEIIEVLNHESVNLYAEHLIKEMGKVFKDEGSTNAGVAVVKQFLDTLGLKETGMFIEDGSGLSPQDAINSAGLSELLFLMKKSGKHFSEYLNSLPEAGNSGTLKNHFMDPVFTSSMRAKSGSMERVRSYAGYLTAKSGKELVFSIIIDNYSGPSSPLISHIEEILKETILNN